MNFKEQLEAIKKKFQDKATADKSADELAEINDSIAELDALGQSHDAIEEENAKLKETIVRVVQTSGSGDKPKDESAGGDTPKTFEEIIAEELAKK